MKVTFPPDSAPQGHNIDPAKIAQEYLAKLPGLAEAFEVDHPGMHRTQTLDYAVVLDGEIWLELDNGNVRALKTGDVVVQTGTRHAWRNKGTRPVTMLFVLIGSS